MDVYENLSEMISRMQALSAEELSIGKRMQSLVDGLVYPGRYSVSELDKIKYEFYDALRIAAELQETIGKAEETFNKIQEYAAMELVYAAPENISDLFI